MRLCKEFGEHQQLSCFYFRILLHCNLRAYFSMFRVPQPKCVNVAIDCDREIERIHSLFLMNLEKLDELQSKSLVKVFRIKPVHIQVSYRIELGI